MTNADPKWKRFEKLVAKVQKDLAPKATVTHNDKIAGKDSGKERQIDVSVKVRTGQYDLLIIISCKDYKEPVDVEDVGSFAAVVEDVRANQGAMVAANGFTDGAKQLAATRGINLYRLVDAEKHDWQTKIAIPATCEELCLKSFGLIFSSTDRMGFYAHEADMRNVMLYGEDQKPLGKVVDLLLKKWNAKALPMEPGEYSEVEFLDVPVTKIYEDRFCKVKVKARINVEKRLFFGWWPLLEVSGFKDEMTHVITTSKLKTETLTHRDIEDHWTLIANPTEISVEPLAKLTAFISYPVDEEE